MKAIALWSGGKDSCLAYYKAKREGHRITALFNFTDGSHSLSHRLSPSIISEQVKMIGIPLVQKAMPQKTYREEFVRLIYECKSRDGINGIVFGDIYLEEHKDWIDKVCRELKVNAIMPLWGADTRRLVAEFIDSGFEAIIVTTKADLLGEEWLGRKIDKRFLDELGDGIDPCGESGEFHTFVYNGPIFKRPVGIVMGEKTLKDGHWYADVSIDNLFAEHL